MSNIAKAFCTDFKATWNFFESRHSKGEADGESAVVKNYLDTVVRSQQLTLHDVHDCYSLLQASNYSN